MLGSDGADAFGQPLHQGQRGFAVGAVFAGRIFEAVAKQVVQILDRQTALFDLPDDLDETQGLTERIVFFDRRQRIWMQRLERVEAREVLERDELADGELE